MKNRAVVIAVEHDSKAQEVQVVPFAVLIDGNPYEMFDPPDPDGPGYLSDAGNEGA